MNVGDLIRRCDVLDNINKRIYFFDKASFDEAVKAVCNAPAVDAIPRWISVEERLPETHKTVLVYVTNPVGWRNVEIDWMDEQGWVCNADSEWHTITHWMPIPQPPEEPA